MRKSSARSIIAELSTDSTKTMKWRVQLKAGKKQVIDRRFRTELTVCKRKHVSTCDETVKVDSIRIGVEYREIFVKEKKRVGFGCG